MASVDFKDLVASLEWGVTLPLTREQRAQIKDLCCRTYVKIGHQRRQPVVFAVFRLDPPTERTPNMDWNRVEGNWKQAKGKVKEKWGKLTDDDLTTINGRRDQLEGKIQERYGLAKDQVKRDVDDWYAAQDWS